MMKRLLSLPVTVVLLAVALSGFISAVGAQTADDNIPNAIAYSWGASQAGDLDFATDTDDVYRVDLKKGMLVSVTLSGGGGTDFDLYLFGPEAVNVLEDNEVARSEKLGSSAESIRYTAGKDGTYYLDVATWDTKGSYTLVMKVRPKVSIARSREVYDYNAGTAASLSGAMDPPRASVRLDIQSQAPGSSSWATAGHATAGADGKYTFSFKPYQTSSYRARWAGDSAFLGSNSNAVQVKVKPKVDAWSTSTLDLAQSDATSPVRPTSATLTGSLRSSTQLPSGLTVYIEIKETTESDWSRASVKTAGKGAFSYTFSSGTVANFHVRARFPGDSRWLGVTSGTRTIRVNAS